MMSSFNREKDFVGGGGKSKADKAFNMINKHNLDKRFTSSKQYF